MGRKTTGKTLADADEAVRILWEETRRDPSYREKCKSWIKLRRNKKHKEAKKAYLEIATEHNFPPMNYKLSLEDNIAEQIEAMDVENSAEPGEEINIEEAFPYSDGGTKFFLEGNVWNDLFFRVEGYSKMPLPVYAPVQDTKLMEFIEPGTIIEAKTMRVVLNLDYPKKMVLEKLSQLIDKCQGLKEIENMSMDPDGKEPPLRIFQTTEKERMLESKVLGSGDIVESWASNKICEGADDLCMIPKSRLRLDKYNQTYKFVESDLKKYLTSAFLNHNEILGVRWDDGEFDILRKERKKNPKKQITRKEGVRVLNEMLKKRFPKRVYEKIQNNSALKKKLSIESQIILVKAVKQPLRDMSPEELEHLNRKVFELAFPQNIKKKHPDYLSRRDRDNEDQLIDLSPHEQKKVLPCVSKQPVTKKRKSCQYGKPKIVTITI